MSNKESRISSTGPSYFPLSMLIPAGEDIDRVLVRPQLRRPTPAALISILAKSAGFTRAVTSDKGFYSQDTISKFGGLDAVARFLRDAKKRGVLNKFLDNSENNEGVFDEGVRLSIDRRRYVNFSAIAKIIGSPDSTADLIDDLVGRTVLLRGMILKCKFCRNADWFSVGQIGQEFECRRCGRRQHVKRENWFGSNAESYEAAFFYKLDEIVFQGLRNDMDIPLLALSAIQKGCDESFIFAPETWFFKEGESKPWIEADLLCVADGKFIVGEVKSTPSIGSTANEEKASLNKYKELASALGARRIVLATSSPAWSPGTQNSINTVFKDSDLEVVILTAHDLFE